MSGPAPPPEKTPAKPSPTVYQLAEMLHRTHWVMEQLAYDLPAGTATQGQVDEVARALEGLAPLLRDHDLS